MYFNRLINVDGIIDILHEYQSAKKLIYTIIIDKLL